VQSLNVTTIKIVQDIGIDYVSLYAKRLGIRSPLTQDLSISLGSSAVTLEELVTAYAHFPSQGKHVQPIYIKRVEDRSRNILEENTVDTSNSRSDDIRESFEEATSSLINQREREEEVIRIMSTLTGEAEGKSTEANDIIGTYPSFNLPLPDGYVITPETAYIMTHLLSDVVQFGTGQNVRELGRPSAGKTGTTNEYKDAWFIGFTPELVAGVWVGFDEIETLGRGETGARAASPIWLEFMQDTLKDFEHKDFQVPGSTIVFAAIDPKTGKRADSKTKNTITEAFIKGTVPEKSTNAASDSTHSADDFFFEE
jgi:penicillin-binding protein 1A